MNRTELVAAVRSYLNRPNLPTSDIATMISSVEGELNRILREHPRNIRRTTFTLLATNDGLLAMPFDLMQLIELRDANGNLSQFPPDDRAGAARHGHAFIMRGMVAELFPAPVEDTTYTLDYVAALRPLQGDFDSNWVSTYFSDLYLYGVLKEAAVYLKDDVRLAAWQQEFTRRAAGVVGQGWNQDISSAPRIRIG
jgi:hypothetical protein